MTRIAITLLAVFFAIATCILIGVGTALLHPGTALDAIWRLKPDREPELMARRALVGPAFLLLAVPMAVASFGCFIRRPWGRWLAIAIFTINGIGDLVQLAIGHVAEGGIGVAIAACLISYLMRPRTKAAFA